MLAPTSRRHLLWDTSVLLGYYLEEARKNDAARERARIIIESVRNHRTDAMFYVPSIVVAETFTAMDRHCYSSWDPEINKKYGGAGKTLHRATYRAARQNFRRDIHNGALFYQLELSRYHVLSLDLVAPVDKHRKFYRSQRTRSMGASDLLVGAMAMDLVRRHGRDVVALMTADRRMHAIFERTCCTLNPNTAHDLGLSDAAAELGYGPWSGALYPMVIDLARCTDKVLLQFFGQWPLVMRKRRNVAPRA